MSEATPKTDWLGPWAGLIHCPNCHALMGGSECPMCKYDHSANAWAVVNIDGKLHRIPVADQGAMSWTAHSLLRLMQREWERPIPDDAALVPPLGKPCSQRALVVILFWTLFEHLMEQFFQSALSHVPEGVRADLLRRYQSIGSRMDRLYTMLFNVKLTADLESLGFGNVFSILEEIQTRRNRFIHGDAEAIDDELVQKTIEHLSDVQRAWLALYNLRCTGDPTVARVWEDQKHREIVKGAKS